MDMYRPNASIFLYGTPGPHSRYGARHEKSPIFALSSPSLICPYVYAGTTGRVYELEVSEMNVAGKPIDPYFASPSDAGRVKLAEELVMYEMDGTDSALLANVPGSLYTQESGTRIINPILVENESRLDTRWR
jgi:hypothetical protein